MAHPSIVPAILVRSERAFRERLRAVEHIAPVVHVDVMDGRFVPTRTWANPRTIARIRTCTRFSIHLMVRDPLRHATAWAQVPRVTTIIVHTETRDAARTIATILAAGKRAGVALNPGTSLAAVSQLLRASSKGRRASIPEFLLMANAPGFSGRPFAPATLGRVRALRRVFPRCVIGVDIGVNARTIPRIARAGATYGAANSAIFNADHPAIAYATLRHLFQRHRL